MSLLSVDTSFAQTGLNGVFQNYFAVQTTEEHEFIAARNRLRLKFEKPADFGGLYSEMDVIHRFTNVHEIEFQLKEAYFDWFLEKTDIRTGHQKIIWGRANGAFVTDIVTPADLREFLTISPEDIRFGITALNAIRYFGANSVQFVLAPFFQPDLLPSSESRWFPAREYSSAFEPLRVNSNPPDQPFSLKDVQLALRFSLLSPENSDIDLFLMRWTHPSPAYEISFDLNNFEEQPAINLTETYRNSWMGGFSASLKIAPRFFFLTETLLVQKKLFTALPFPPELRSDALSNLTSVIEILQRIDLNDEFLITKPWIHSMAGIRTVVQETTIEVQGFLEGIIHNEDQILQEEFYKYVTFLTTRAFLRERLQLFTLSRYNVDTDDFWVQLQGRYELADNLEWTVGANMFGGKKADQLSGHLLFSQFRDNSFIFSKIAFFF